MDYHLKGPLAHTHILTEAVVRKRTRDGISDVRGVELSVFTWLSLLSASPTLRVCERVCEVSQIHSFTHIIHLYAHFRCCSKS